MSTLTVALIALTIIVVAYFLNKDIISKTEIYFLENELKEYKKLIDINLEIENKKKEYNKLENEIESIKQKNNFSTNKLISYEEIQLKNEYLQN